MSSCVALECSWGVELQNLRHSSKIKPWIILSTFHWCVCVLCAGTIIPVDIQEALNVTAPMPAPTAAPKASG